METDLILELTRFVERISAIARTGLAFKPDGYDSERYHELLKDAARMHAVLSQADPSSAEMIHRQWIDSIGDGYHGYVTTGVGVGAIAFNRHGQVLMMKRPSNRWWYPTGFCEVGLSPAENVIKEVREEVGVTVQPLRLMGIIDSLKAGSPARHLYAILFYCRAEEGAFTLHPLEALEAGFFDLDHLPEPLHGIDRKWIRLAREFHFEGRTEAFFDPH